MAAQNRLPLLRAGLGTIALTLFALGADSPTQTIDCEGMTFKAPRAWKAGRVSQADRFRRAQLTASPIGGDTDPAELVVTAFPQGAGGVEANVKRWQSQFEGKDGVEADVASEERKGKNVTVTFVDVSGHYVAPIRPASPKRNDKPDYRLFGVIVPGSEGTYFLKMVGPARTMKAALPDFEKLIASIQVTEP